ncbi:MAG: MarR family EPS-associated transcriptional regulator [Reinekea sp.]
MPTLSDELRYKLFKSLKSNPSVSQRELSQLMGISLGKTNFCIQALLEVGWIKASNFKNSKNKPAYSYLLTPQGIEEKLNITKRFLKFKLREYEVLQKEIEDVREELRRVEEITKEIVRDSRWFYFLVMLAENFLAGSPAALVLSDNVFYGHDFMDLLSNASSRTLGAMVFGYHVENPKGYGVAEFDKNGSHS